MDAKTVLLVEDNPDDVELTLRAFRKANLANRIVVATDGDEALDYLFGTGRHSSRDVGDTPALVLLDLKLPKVDGLEVLRRVRADPRTNFVPVVILTSSIAEQDLIDGDSLGADSYIRKPIDFDRFSAAVVQNGLYWLIVNEAPRVRRLREY